MLLLLAFAIGDLLTASYTDDLPAASQLIRAGADVNAANDLGATPLWAACQNGSLRMVDQLLAAGANPNAALLSGETPLMVAARVGHPEIVQRLLRHKANPNAKATRGQTALMWAVAQKHPAVVKVLIAGGANIFVRTDTWSEVMAVEPHGYLPYNRAIPHGNDTALLFAARVGDLESAKILLAAGANANDADAWGVSALTLAAHSGFRDIVDLLLGEKADPNAAPAGFTALHIAIVRRDEAMAKALLDHGADPNTPLTTWTPKRRSSRDFYFDPALVGASPFWLAARYLQPNVLRLLAAKGANPRFTHHSHTVTEGRFEAKTQVSTPAEAAQGKGGGGPAWIEPPRTQREALVSETVKTAIELTNP